MENRIKKISFFQTIDGIQFKNEKDAIKHQQEIDSLEASDKEIKEEIKNRIFTLVKEYPLDKQRVAVDCVMETFIELRYYLDDMRKGKIPNS
jgi:hypothetical protein